MLDAEKDEGKDQSLWRSSCRRTKVEDVEADARQERQANVEHAKPNAGLRRET